MKAIRWMAIGMWMAVVLLSAVQVLLAAQAGFHWTDLIWPVLVVLATREALEWLFEG